jgi:hypothetical protein
VQPRDWLPLVNGDGIYFSSPRWPSRTRLRIGPDGKASDAVARLASGTLRAAARPSASASRWLRHSPVRIVRAGAGCRLVIPTPHRIRQIDTGSMKRAQAAVFPPRPSRRKSTRSRVRHVGLMSLLTRSWPFNYRRDCVQCCWVISAEQRHNGIDKFQPYVVGIS